MNLPKTGDTVTIEHYGKGKVLWTRDKCFKVKIEKRISVVRRQGVFLENISCYLSDLISIDKTATDCTFDELPKIQAGSIVRHDTFGYGKVKEIREARVYGMLEPNNNAVINFDFPHLQKTLYLPYAKLHIISY